jgi:putative transcriptional regulator
MYKPIEIDRQNLTIMGVRFSDIDTLNSAANAIGSNMFEGFEPTPRLVEIYRDYREGKISNNGFIEMLRGAV